jgi:osmotically-inducible protein OsmY
MKNITKTNLELQHDVMEEIKWDPRLKSVASEIGVTAKEGVITLTGEVDTYRKKLAATKAAQRVGGVRIVVDEIEVTLSGESHQPDIEIAEAAKDIFRWNNEVDGDDIEIKVEKGWVYLDGEVEWEYQKRNVEKAVHDLKGVRGVTNRIALQSKPLSSKDVKDKIISAFHRSATIDATFVNVKIHGSRVELKGKVRTWAERQEAENAAWSLAGVTSVDNKIEVDTTLSLMEYDQEIKT